MVGRALRVLVVSSLVAVGALSVGAGAASASVAATSLGYDVSFPQCGHALPAAAGFGVVGVNNGHPFSVNPCLASEITWAGTTLSASPQFYVNTDNPGPTNNANWPTSQSAPRACSGANSPSCSYDYGWNAAQASFQAVVSAETQLSAASPTAAALGAQWWLDVETGNAWQSLRTGAAPTSAQFANDAASIQGQIAYFASIGVGTVGIYATSLQWGAIVGHATGTAFAQNPLWVPGYATLAAAQAACSMASFTGARVAMIQYPSNGLDGDYVCGLIVTPASATISLAAVAGFSAQLVVAGESAVTFTQATGSPNLTVSPSGVVTASATLTAGTYSATGTAGAAGLTGNFSFALTVGTLVQTGTTSAAASVPASATFTTQLTGVGGSGPLSFAATSGSPSLLVSPTGLVSTSGSLARGTYKVAGTMGDAFGDLGTFSFALRVGALSQSSPIRATITPAASATYTYQLTATGASGALTFTQSAGAPALVVSATGLVTTSGTLANGSYVVRGVASDAYGDQGNYFFNLLVSATTLTQTSPATASVTPSASSTYTGQIAVSGGAGALVFTQTRGAPALVVSSSGAVTTSGALVAGTYVASGNVADASGDRGTFTLTLSVASSTPPPTPLPIATRVLGHAVAGRTVVLRIIGKGFIGRPTVVGPVGTTATVIGDTGTVLTVRVRVDRRSRPGVHTFVIAMSNGKICSVRFVQR